jgi:dipeptidyl-peptidase-4
MARCNFTFLAAWVALAAAQAASPSFSWAPGGRQIAYCGTLFSPDPQLWIIDAETGARRSLPGGEAGCTPTWSPTGNTILIAGPRSLDLVTPLSEEVQTIASGSPIRAARFSPDGNSISYSTNGQLLVRSLVNGTTRIVTSSDVRTLRAEPDWLYRNKLGLDAAYWWSPDSSAIAYLEIERTAKQFPVAGDPLPRVALRIAGQRNRAVQLPAGEAYFPQIVWSPDSASLAIQRLDRAQQSLELLLADARTGAVRCLLEESDPYWINADPRGVAFLPDAKHFLWTSERTGFRHIFLYETSGKPLAQVTGGDWEVTGIEAVDARAVTFTSAQQASTERHLYRSSLDKPGPPLRITAQRGWHTALIAPGGDAFLDFSSSTAQLPSVSIVRAGAAEIVLSAPESKLLPVELTTIPVRTDMAFNAMLIRPAGFDPAKKYPAVILAPAGPRAQIVRDASDNDVFLWAQSLARQGFVVFAADGRGSGGRGHRFEEPIHFRLGGMELPDQLDALGFLGRQGFVDMRRVGIFGSGYAGMIALGAMMHSHGIYLAGMADSPITDWTRVDAYTAERYLGPKTANAISYDESSPNEFAKRLEGRLLITAEANGPALEHVKALREELEENNKLTPKLASIETMARTKMFARATRFFEEMLR